MTVANTRNRLKSHQNIYRNIYHGNSTNSLQFMWSLVRVWSASVIKLCWGNFLLWIVLYAIISAVYRNVLCDGKHLKERERFELFVIYVERFVSKIPITFLTGFYVSQVVNRWWDQFMSLPWPDRFALKLVTIVPGTVIGTSYALFKQILNAD